MQIAEHRIGAGQPTYIIAEASANHYQDFDRAVALVIAAANAGLPGAAFPAGRMARGGRFRTYDRAYQ